MSLASRHRQLPGAMQLSAMLGTRMHRAQQGATPLQIPGGRFLPHESCSCQYAAHAKSAAEINMRIKGKFVHSVQHAEVLNHEIVAMQETWFPVDPGVQES